MPRNDSSSSSSSSQHNSNNNETNTTSNYSSMGGASNHSGTSTSLSSSAPTSTGLTQSLAASISTLQSLQSLQATSGLLRQTTTGIGGNGNDNIAGPIEGDDASRMISESQRDNRDDNDVSNNHEENAAAKRKQIQSILGNQILSDFEKRLKIQDLMDGRGRARSSISSGFVGDSSSNSSTTHSTAATTDCNGRIVNHFGIPVNPNTNASFGALGLSRNNFISSKYSSNTTSKVGNCVHYERKCNIVAPCCQHIYGCRLCHDEHTVNTCGPMDRFAVKEIVCKECNMRQPTSNECIQCGITFAEHHCAKCNIWMSLAKEPFHCDKCGFCRVGGAENFKHCDICNMCISISVFDNHNCLKDKYKNNCPVCREDMFSSRQPPQDLPCGHAIHSHCFRKLSGFDYRCPICKKTAISKESMASAWSARASDIAMQPMPPDLVRKVAIKCIDCGKKNSNLDWHFLGVQCPECASFNTIVEDSGTNSSTT